MLRSCRPYRAAIPISRPSWSRRSSPMRCCGKALKLRTTWELLARADVNLPVAHGDRHRRQPHRGVARMAAGREIEFVAVPRADDVALLAEAQPGALLVGGDDFLDLMENLALADRAAGMRTDILISQHFAAGPENADFDIVQRK